MIDQTDLFEKFCADSNKMQEALEHMLRATKAYHRFGIPLPERFGEWQATFEDLEQPSIGGLFDITSEIGKLR